MQLLAVPREQRPSFRRQLKGLVAEGLLVEVRGKRFGLADKMDLVVGRLQLQTGGYAFVVADPPRDRRDPDVFIAAPHVQEAMHGDRVVARVERLRDGDRPEGRVVKILERANQRIVGRFDVDAAGIGFVAPFDRRLQTDVAIPPAETLGAQARHDGRRRHRPVADGDTWANRTGDRSAGQPRRPRRRHHRHRAQVRPAGRARRGGARRGEATRRRRRRRERDARAQARPRRAHRFPGPRHRHDRRRARARLRRCDFDRAARRTGTSGLGCTSRTCRTTSARAARSTPRRTTAARRCTSRTGRLHMFPEELATGLCSLNPKVDRLVQSCLMEVDRHGHRGAARVPRRHHPHARADDLHRRGRHPGRRCGSRGPVRPARADVRADARALRGAARPAPTARVDRLRFRRSRGGARRGRTDRGHRRVRAEHRASDHRGVHAARQRDGGRVPRGERCSGALPGPRAARPAQGGEARGVRVELRAHPRRAADRGPSAALPVAARADSRQARGARGGRAHPAHDAEGALRAGEPRSLRAGVLELHPLHVADPALSGSRRAPAPPRGESGGRECGAARAADGRPAGDRPPDVGARAAGRRSGARAASVEEGPLHAGQGGRRLRRLHHRRRVVRPVRRTGGALRRGARARVEHGGRLLPIPRGHAHAPRREPRPRLPPRRPRAGARRPSGHGQTADRTRARRDPRRRAKGRAAGERGAARRRDEARTASETAAPGKNAGSAEELHAPATSSSAPLATSTTARAPSCWRSPGPIPIG